MKKMLRIILFILVTLQSNLCIAIKTDVLIIGAGPSGLVLANLLDKLEINYVIIDKNSKPSVLSRATGIHRNSLRLLSQIGLSKGIIQNSLLLNGSQNFKDYNFVSTINFSQGDFSFDKNVSINQNSFEKLLASRLKNNVMRGYELLNFQTKEGVVTAELMSNNNVTVIEAKFLIGADGYNSTVRKNMINSYAGITTPELSFTFDARIKNRLTKNNMFTYETNGKRLVVIPIPGKNLYKFSGRIYGEDFSKENINKIIYDRSNIEIITSSISGLSFYHTQSRVANNFVDNNIILVGDAAHVFFPAGGYGLNFGIEDAFSLAWRLKNISNGGSIKLINDYSDERMYFINLFQEDSKIKKEQSEKMNFENFITEEKQAYNHKISKKYFQRVDDQLFNYLYKKIDNKKAFHNYSYKIIQCYFQKTILNKKINFENKFPINLTTSFHQVISDKCSSERYFLIRPDLFYNIYENLDFLVKDIN